MKRSVAAAVVLALGPMGAHAFAFAPSFRAPAPAATRLSATAAAGDAYAPVVQAVSAAADAAQAAAARAARLAAEAEGLVTSLEARVAAEKARLAAAEGLAASEAQVASLKSRVAAEKARLVDPAAVAAAPVAPRPAVAMAAMAGTVAEGSTPAPTSPLARLLADELGLDLGALGLAGSGKNGKIMIDDVRRYQARMEATKGGAVGA